MNPDFAAFVSANATAIIIVAGLLAAFGIVQWRKVRVAEEEAELKQTLLDKGVPVAEVERAVAAKAPTRRGWIEQFGTLSGGAKAGIIFGFLIVSVVAAPCLAGMLYSYAVVSHVREQPAVAAPRPPVEVPPPLQLTPVEKVDAIAGHAFYLDLQPVANRKLTDVTGVNDHSLAALPQHRRDFGGVPFQVGPGYIRLRGKNRPELPKDANGVRVGFKFDKLHIFHGTEYGAFGDAAHRFHVPDGTEIGHYRVRYADKSERVIPVVYGEDVRDAWNWDRSKPVPRGKVAWTGRSPGATKEGVTLRLYLTAWVNPRPDDEVAEIDFASACETAASPFCVALTAERMLK
jgi:hypothetical protein